ncbi:MAG: DUF6191 domain-containing protein [bacterium]
MTQFGGLDTLFNPAKRHLDEERLRLQSTREEVGDASGGKRIDFASGKVRIGKSRTADAADADASDADGPASAVPEGVTDTETAPGAADSADTDTTSTDTTDTGTGEAHAAAATETTGRSEA